METPELSAHRPLPPVEGSSPGETGRPVPHRRTAEGTQYAPSDRGAAVEQPRSPLSEQEILKMQVAELTAKLSAVRYATRSTRRGSGAALFHRGGYPCHRCHPRLTPNALTNSQGGA